MGKPCRFKLKCSDNSNDKFNNIKFKLAHYLRLGLDLEEARKLVDCSKQTLNVIRCDLDFEDFVQKCLAQGKVQHIENIQNAGREAWQASAWWLERRFPSEYGKKDTVKFEYQTKLNTLLKLFVKLINELVEDPHVRYQIANRLRNYQFDGSEIMDHSFQTVKQLPDNSVIDLGEEDG